jgi:hypothetical protein
MSKSDKKNLFYKFFILGVLISCLLSLSKSVSFFGLAMTQDMPQDTRLPEILVAAQPESPLVISPLRVESPEPHAYEILYNLTNISKKPIRAYTIREVMFVGGQEQKGATWVDLDLTNKVLRPNESIPEGYAFSLPSKQTPSDITLAVDFIEFTDDTTWGADNFEVAGRIVAQRSGARETGKHLLQIFKEGGAKAVVKALESDALDFLPPAGHSPEWNQAFVSGQNIIRTRLKKAMERGGLNQVERELLERISKVGETK